MDVIVDVGNYLKIGLNDYTINPYNCANFRGNWSKGVCSPNSCNITYS